MDLSMAVGYGIAGFLGVLALFVFLVRRRRRRAYSSRSSERAYMLVQDDGGLQYVPCLRDEKRHGFNLRGYFIPEEFVSAVRHGPAVYMLATHYAVPADGDMTHDGGYADLIEVPQPRMLASWADADRARRRLNWAAVFERGDGSLAGLKNLAYGVMVVALLLTTFQVFSIKSGVGSLRDAVVLSSEAALRDAAARPLPVDVGAPAGDQ